MTPPAKCRPVGTKASHLVGMDGVTIGATQIQTEVRVMSERAGLGVWLMALRTERLLVMGVKSGRATYVIHGGILYMNSSIGVATQARNLGGRIYLSRSKRVRTS